MSAVKWVSGAVHQCCLVVGLWFLLVLQKSWLNQMEIQYNQQNLFVAEFSLNQHTRNDTRALAVLLSYTQAACCDTTSSARSRLWLALRTLRIVVGHPHWSVPLRAICLMLWCPSGQVEGSPRRVPF
ncbi:hypothetical protein PF005_g1169 [Phytophthora fragariae]|uniref:Uncharacterized protein n=1 Tax=Phytophthora fragariae TaxID=53985 RepID=A0A6A3FZ51_9STRA|nr:hypothetical protein PF003_g333 [Phytophthora fragariae]KAE8949530.1 hypothetical protein PF009_g936 [Phytophthora fragariae]KAE9030116.1 hypothetical protein PF011_g756 [Phytophthora fragariae]KAE9133178.1 hypothetical protein PF007_g3444 [Phytophthora fragariae]KAE9153034.1 hypothetical protein PF006_g2792 [Phytophthora fragariae]